MATYQVQDPSGQLHEIEGPEGASPDEITTQAQNLVPKTGMVESFARGAANNFPLAPQAIAGGESLFGNKGYSENLEDWNKKAAQAKEAHPVVYGAGAVGGTLAPLLIPGVGEALEASPLAGNAALGAASAISNTNLVKDPEQALKQAAGGAALGAGTAFGVGKLFPKPASLEGWANKEAVESIGMSPAYLKELKPEEYEALGPSVRKLGLVGTDKEEILQKALQHEKSIGQKIGAIGKNVDSDIGASLDERDKVSAVYPLMQKAEEFGGSFNREAKSLSRSYKEGIEDILKLGDNPSWSNVQKLKQQYGDIAFSDTGEVKNKAAKDVYFSLRDMLKTMTKRVQDNPSLPQEYKEALSAYHQMDPVVEGLKGFVGRERAGVSGHGVGHGFLPRIIRSLPGQSNPKINLGTAAVMTAISPHLGPIMALPTLTNPAIQSKAASFLAEKLPGIRQGATQEVIGFLESRHGKHDYQEK